MTKQLSPAAQAVIEAYNAAPPNGIAECADVLRAAASSAPHKYRTSERWIRAGVMTAIAAELEAQQ